MIRITVYHTAFRDPLNPVGTTSIDTEGYITDAATLREDVFNATNAPVEMLSAWEQHLYGACSRKGRTYSTSVGDLVTLRDLQGHHSLARVESTGFSVIAEGEDVEASLASLLHQSQAERSA